MLGLIRAVEFRELEAGLSCVMGFGSDAWDQPFGVHAQSGTSPKQRGNIPLSGDTPNSVFKLSFSEKLDRKTWISEPGFL